MAYDNIRFVKPNMEFVDGYFFTMDETRKSLLQKSDDGSTVFEYPCQIDPGFKIYFDNFDTNTYNPSYWTYGGTNGGFREGKFWSKRNSGASSGNTVLSSKFRAKGTYDIRIDYNLILLQSINWSGAQFQLVNYDVADTYLQVRRDYSSRHRYYADVKSGGAWTSVGNITTTDIVGGMRFYRAYNSTTTTVYYKSGVTGSWVGMGSTSTVGIGSSNNIQVKFFATSGSPYPEVEFEFDNFYMSIALSGITSLQYDGIYFWTLQYILGTGEPVIRKWLVRNYACELINELIIENSTGNTYDVDTFAIEHYITELTSTVSGGDTTIHIDEYYDTVVTSGSILSIGDNGDSNLEDVVVSEVIGSDVVLSGSLLYDHSEGTKVVTSPSLFLFNNYSGTSSSIGSLLRLNAYNGDFITSTSGLQYKNVTASTFDRVQNLLREYADVHTIIFVKSTQSFFLNIDDYSYYGIMNIDNIRANGSTVIPVYDLSYSNGNLYRLQDEGTYYGVDNDWGTQYNYVVSPVRSFIDAITIEAYPIILPADGRNIAQINCVVLDQFSNGAIDKPITFTDTDTYGYITINPKNTDSIFGTGQAITYYRAGTDIHTVTIQGTVTQYD